MRGGYTGVRGAVGTRSWYDGVSGYVPGAVLGYHQIKGYTFRSMGHGVSTS